MHSELLLQLRQSLAVVSDLPRYQQLYEVLRQQILDGLLLPGTRLPSSRILAQHLTLARNTVLAALEQLCAEGYTSARPAAGIYIQATAPIDWGTHAVDNRLSTSPGLSIRGQRISHLADKPVMRGAFTTGIPDIKQFPFELWHRYVSRHARNPKLDWQAYPQQGGNWELRAAIADYLRLTRGIRCEAAQVLITHGTQQSLHLVANLLANPGDRAWLEDPGYSGACSVLDAAGLTVIAQPVDTQGLAPPTAAWQAPPRLIYTTPSHQFPLGVVMSAARRRHLLALAAQHQAWIIEDDYDSEFRYAGAPLAALHALAPQQVIYLGTFSKTLFPALRLGYMVLPENLVDVFRATQARHHREPSYVTQQALADFMRDGHINAYVRKMRHEYRSRRDCLLGLLQRELGDTVRCSGFDTGLHFVMYLPEYMHDQVIEAEAWQRGIIARALTHHYADTTPASARAPALLLGFADADTKDITRAGKILVQVIAG